MAMKRCPVCGEEYSETYKSCPFCEEAAAMDQGRPVHRRGGRRASPQRDPNILTPVLVVVILVLALLLVYLFFGSAIKDKLGLGDRSSQPIQSSQSSQAGGSLGAASAVDPGILQEPDISAPEPAGSGTGGGSDLDLEAVAKLPKTLTVNNPDFTLTAGETYTVKVTAGGNGSYTWLSSDDGVVSVDETGKVTAIAKGRAEITVTDGSGRGECIVYVKGGAAPAAGNGGTTDPAASREDGKTPTLNREDFTLPVGQTWQLTISGITTAVTWSSKDPGVATVSANGTVTAVSKGTTTITASYDNTKLTCIVRVP